MIERNRWLGINITEAPQTEKSMGAKLEVGEVIIVMEQNIVYLHSSDIILSLSTHSFSWNVCSLHPPSPPPYA